MSDIYYFSEDIDFSLKDQKRISNWIEDAIKEEGYVLSEINYIFCSDSYLLNINQDFLDHDTYTDIITFDNSTEEGHVESDIYISVERVKENAASFKASFEEELHRVMIHGILHLLGWMDKTDEDKRNMRQKEDACISLLHQTN